MTRLLPIETNTDVVSLTVIAGGDATPGWIRYAFVEVQRSVNRIPFARLRIDDGDPARGDFAASASEVFAAGQEIVIEAGYHGAVEQIFAGIVTRQKIGVRDCKSWLEVECRDIASKMTLTRRNRFFVDATDADAITEILSDYEISGDLADTPATHPQLVQYQATDWDFLMARLDANGQFCAIEDGRLRSFVPELAPDGAPVALFGTNLIELDAEFDARSQTAAVTGFAWDAVEQAPGEVEAADPGWTLPGEQSAEDLSGVTGREADQVWHGGQMSADALQALADGMLLRSRLAGARGRARVQGFASVALGQTLALDGLGTRFAGGVMVTGIRHALVNSQWTVDLEFGIDPRTHAERFDIDAPPAAATTPAVAGLQIGVVTQIHDDPEGEGRIRVRLPVNGAEEEGIWARLATLDAGADGRGSYFVPEVEDEVVVGFFHDDPAYPIILGGLHSSAKPAAEEPSEDNFKKGFQTREGLKLIFDDEAPAVIVETPNGNMMTLSDGDEGIVIADQNGNSISMTSDGIAIESAGEVSITAGGDLKAEGVNAELKASAEFKAEGAASAAFSSSGMLEISGSLVMIN